MGDPAKDKKALDELKEHVEYSIKPALKRYTEVRPDLKSGLTKLDAAVAHADAEVITFEQRTVTALTQKIGGVIIDIDDAIASLQQYADDPDYAVGHDQAVGHVHALGAAKKQLAEWLAKADRHLGRAGALAKKVAVRSGYIEAQWAKVRAQLVEGERLVVDFAKSVERELGNATEAARIGNAVELEKARYWADKNVSDGFISGQIRNVKSALAAFEADLKKVKPSAEFVAVFTRERADVVDRVAELDESFRGMVKSLANIIELKVRLDMRKIAETLGLPREVVEKLGPQLSQNDAVKLKALDAVAKKHELDKSPRELLAALQKRGLVGRA